MTQTMLASNHMKGFSHQQTWEGQQFLKRKKKKSIFPTTLNEIIHNPTKKKNQLLIQQRERERERESERVREIEQDSKIWRPTKEHWTAVWQPLSLPPCSHTSLQNLSLYPFIYAHPHPHRNTYHPHSYKLLSPFSLCNFSLNKSHFKEES